MKGTGRGGRGARWGGDGSPAATARAGGSPLAPLPPSVPRPGRCKAGEGRAPREPASPADARRRAGRGRRPRTGHTDTRTHGRRPARRPAALADDAPATPPTPTPRSPTSERSRPAPSPARRSPGGCSGPLSVFPLPPFGKPSGGSRRLSGRTPKPSVRCTRPSAPCAPRTRRSGPPHCPSLRPLLGPRWHSHDPPARPAESPLGPPPAPPLTPPPRLVPRPRGARSPKPNALGLPVSPAQRAHRRSVWSGHPCPPPRTFAPSEQEFHLVRCCVASTWSCTQHRTLRNLQRHPVSFYSRVRRGR